MLDFKINSAKCVKCGLCMQDCPVRIIEMNPLPFIKEKKEAACLKCQHCLAICPTGALSILGKNPEESASTKDPIPSHETMERLIKTRRSIRKFKKEELNKTVIHHLLESASYAPTGHNDNSVLFSVIDSKKELEWFREKTYQSIKEAAETGKLAPAYSSLNGLQKLWYTKNIDVIFRDAPHMVITSAPKDNASPEPDALIALSYFELLANTHGIGTLWNGMVKWAINDIDPQLRNLLGIPKNHILGYVMLFGKSAVRYTRGIQTDGTHIQSIKFTD